MVNMIEATRQQTDVIESKAPLKRVIACAGSGKTWVLTQSIVRALEEGWCRPDEILALTFTINAAENMRRRIGKLLGSSDLDLDIYTFNSFGNEIIYQNSYELGLGKDFQLITSSQSWQILYEVFGGSDLSGVDIGKNTGKFVQDLLSFIEDVKNNLISVRELEEYLEKSQDILDSYKSRALRKQEEEINTAAAELFEVYKRYEGIKAARNMIDYSDQVFLPYKLLSQRKALREKYSQKYKYILIDEFQDTNVAQARFLTLLYKKGHNRMMIVGDDDQGIYSFRGACVNNILDFENWECFEGEKVSDHFLSVNFRSGPRIIDSTHCVIRKNEKRFEKKVTAGDESRESRVFFNLDQTLDDEAGSIASYIRNLIYDKGLKPGDIAVISRVKKFARIGEALKNAGIRYELIGNSNFNHEPDILFMISWLKLIEDIGDEISMMYLLKSDKYRLGDRDIFFLKNDGESGKRIDLIGGIMDYSRNPYLSSTAKKRLTSFKESLVLYMQKSGVLDLKELISLIFEESGLSHELRSGFGRSYKSRMRNVESLIRIAADFKKSACSPGNADFITYIKDVARTDQDDPDTLEITRDNTVKLMSIHAAKGLEFEAVIIPMLWKNQYLGKSGSSSRFSIPSYLKKDSPVWQDKPGFSSASRFNDALKQQKTEEERRIFYVACSRAKSILLLSHSRYESREDLEGGGKKPRETVPFFDDLVKGSRHIIPLDKEAADYLSGIDESYPGSSMIDGKYFNGTTGKPGRLAVRRKTYDWKKIEDNLAGALGILSRDKRKISPDLGNFLGPGISSGEIEEMLAEPVRKTVKALNIQRHRKSRTIFSLTPLLDYLDCPAMYRWRYEYSIPDRRNLAMEIGEKVHKYIENITRLQHGIGSLDKARLLNNSGKDIKPYIEAFLESRLADIVPGRPEKMFLERLFYYRSGKSFITGKLDRVDITRPGAEIVDYKTGTINSNSLPERYRLQLSTYMAAVSGITGIPLESARGSMIFLGDGKIISIQGNEYQIKQDMEMLAGAIDSISKGYFEPAETKDCRKYCPYKNLCK